MTPIRAASPWLERIAGEIVRGRHVIVHGNVHDLVRWRGGHVPLRDALTDMLQALRYSVIGHYDQVDGLTFTEPDALARIQSAATPPARQPPPAQAPQPQPSPAQASAAQAPPTPQADASPGTAATRVDDRMAQALNSAPPPNYDRPADALGILRRALAQDTESAAFIIDFAELILLNPDHHDRNDRQILALTKKAMIEAAQVGVVRNLLVLVVNDLAAVPEWLYRDEPFIQPIEALRPSFDERHAYLRTISDRFEGADRVAPGASEEAVRVLANLTDGMATSDLDGLWRTSRQQKIVLTEPRELVNRVVLGRPEDPWAGLSGRISDAPAFLGRRVLGQPAAVQQVSRALAAATLGIDFVADPHSLEARPKGVFFFVGPTGVGKTELARALSEFVFDDETALARFDMSTFSEPHAAERFTGAPPGYVGHERGGELTNRVRQRPFSVLLFDEIEKAHASVYDKFLQILDDGRLTDGLGRTAYFSQTLIIFTSNLGAEKMYERTGIAGAPASDPPPPPPVPANPVQEHFGGVLYRDDPTGGSPRTVPDGVITPTAVVSPPPSALPAYSEVARHFQGAVREHFAQTISRPELLGRIGNGIIAFDLLRVEHVDAIARKFLGQLVRTAERRGYRLVVDEEPVLSHVRGMMSDPARAALGGRSIRDALDRCVRDPLVDRLRSGGTRGTYRVTMTPGEPHADVRPA